METINNIDSQEEQQQAEQAKQQAARNNNNFKGDDNMANENNENKNNGGVSSTALGMVKTLGIGAVGGVGAYFICKKLFDSDAGKEGSKELAKGLTKMLGNRSL